MLAGPAAAATGALDPACSSPSKAEAARPAARTPAASATSLPAQGASECLPSAPPRGTGWALCLALLAAMGVTGGLAAQRRSAGVVFS